VGSGQERPLNASEWLAWETPPRWVERAAEHPLELLADHAHCELKAASTSQSLIARHPEEDFLMQPLAEVAAEEMEHFALVHAELARRGGKLGPPQPSPYAAGLAQAARATRRGDAPPLLDRLLVAALIEARSLERFRLLGEHLPDAELAALYRSLAGSEARHRALFLRLARSRFAGEAVQERHARLQELEGRLIAGLPFTPRMHSGLSREGERVE
jgi:tRNA-(ms[2]io[6]A)-hydroxylase